MVNKLSGELLRKSYYLFGEESYKNIKCIRDALIKLENGRVEDRESELFLISLIDHENLPQKFSELKLTENFYKTP